MKKLFFGFVYLFAALSAFSQAPGYMGKKVTLSYASYLHPNGLSIITSGGLEYGGLVYAHALNLNLVIAKSREMCFTFRYSTRKISNQDYRYMHPGSTVSDFEKASIIEYGISTKRFGKSRFAPLGVYSKWELYFMDIRMNYHTHSLVQYTPGMRDFKAGKLDVYGGGTAYSLGKQRVFKDKVVFDIGFRTSIGLMLVERYDSADDYTEYHAQNMRWAYHFLPVIQVYTGVGFLAF